MEKARPDDGSSKRDALIDGRLVTDLASEFSLPTAEVERIIQSEVSRLEKNARVKSFIRVLVSKAVRKSIAKAKAAERRAG